MIHSPVCLDYCMARAALTITTQPISMREDAPKGPQPALRVRDSARHVDKKAGMVCHGCLVRAGVCLGQPLVTQASLNNAALPLPSDVTRAGGW